MPSRSTAASPLLVAAALAVVYVVWGSTYLAIRIGLDGGLPPFVLAASRFLLAGGLLYPWAVRRGDRVGDRPTATHWRSAAIVGGLLLFGGNGAVTWAERLIPSGVAALLVATTALWMALFGRVVFGERFTTRHVVGLLIGFAGVAVLVNPQGAGAFNLLGTGAVLFAALSWAFGSLISRRLTLPSRPLVATAMQMLAAGAMFTVLAVARGELGQLRAAELTPAALGAVAYLVVFGSLLAFSAYVWLLRHADTALVSTYAYVNPAVAVLLGWLVLGERVDARMVLAGGVIVAAVALIVTASTRKKSPDQQEETIALENDEVSLAS